VISEALIKILVCPESKQPVQLADSALVVRINAAIRAGGLKNRSGSQIGEPVDGALVRSDGRVAYAIRDDIPVMLIEEGFEPPRN